MNTFSRSTQVSKLLDGVIATCLAVAGVLGFVAIGFAIGRWM